MYVGRLRSLAGSYIYIYMIAGVFARFAVSSRGRTVCRVSCIEKAESAAVQSDVVFVVVSG